MPPRSSLTSSFAVSDADTEVVCPLKNHDGTSCRKRCLGEKRYRSMQEHIRRAHPEHYISKLPATEESFALMVNTPPSQRPQPSADSPFSASRTSPAIDCGTVPLILQAYDHDRKRYYPDDTSSPATPRTSDEFYAGSFLPTANAAAALAQLHTHRPESDWESEVDALSETEANNRRVRPPFEPAGFRNHIKEEFMHPNHSRPPRELLPSSLPQSPPGRSSTLPPIQRPHKPARPRKQSVTQNARKAKHERTKSKDQVKRTSYEGRKAFSAEPQSAASTMGKRWEDLIDAATSATEEADDDRDLTPVPHSPPGIQRASLPPFPTSHFQSYTASPLQNTLTPPPPDSDTQPFPSVESSANSTQSGQNFHIAPEGLSDSSPSSSELVQIYCAACGRASLLKGSYACTECICGVGLWGGNFALSSLISDSMLRGFTDGGLLAG
ncbi:MAG: hypothetical protein M1819_002670 [Sarea resinae]|nr:MAG: hypothetical protein M1819_002670 [Sarea resinae]